MMSDRMGVVAVLLALWACGAHGSNAFRVFVNQMEQLAPLIWQAEAFGQEGRQAQRYGCIRKDLDIIKTAVQGFVEGEKKPRTRLPILCGDYRGLQSNPVVVSTAQERQALAQLVQEIDALIVAVTDLETAGTNKEERKRFGGEVLRRDLNTVKAGLEEVIHAPRTAPRRFDALIGGAN